MRRLALPLLLVLVITGCHRTAMPPAASKPATGGGLDRLLILMRERLDVMHDVARYKWARRAPIEDPEREAVLLREVAESGTALGLEPEFTRAFFRGQIEAAKAVQRADFRRWEASHHEPEGALPDLAGVLRPRIDGLNRRLLSELAVARARLLDTGSTPALRLRAEELLGGEQIDAEARAAAIAPLLTTGDGTGK